MAKDNEEKKKGIFQSLFFREVENKPAEQPQAAPATPVPGSVTGTPVLDQDIYAQLTKVLVDNNLDGYDYFEFRAAVENMKAMIPGEAERFKAAFAAVSSFVSVDKLSSSIEFYLSKLDDKKKEFVAATTAAMQSRVLAKETQAKTFDATITDHQKQIEKLTQEIAKAQADRTQLLNEAVAERAKIESVQSRFDATYNKVISDTQSDKTKIITYLSAAKV